VLLLVHPRHSFTQEALTQIGRYVYMADTSEYFLGKSSSLGNLLYYCKFDPPKNAKELKKITKLSKPQNWEKKEKKKKTTADDASVFFFFFFSVLCCIMLAIIHKKI
jgi:hypothetical protein